jgi:hypothetical protein
MKASEMTIGNLVNAEGLLKELFPDQNSRPSLRWLRTQQKSRAVPFVKLGRLVMFDPAQVREAWARKKTVNAV